MGSNTAQVNAGWQFFCESKQWARNLWLVRCANLWINWSICIMECRYYDTEPCDGRTLGMWWTEQYMLSWSHSLADPAKSSHIRPPLQKALESMDPGFETWQIPFMGKNVSNLKQSAAQYGDSIIQNCVTLQKHLRYCLQLIYFWPAPKIAKETVCSIPSTHGALSEHC